MKKYIVRFGILGLLMNVYGCTLLEIKEQVDKVQSAGVIKGKVVLQASESGPVIVRLIHIQGKTYVADGYNRASDNGEYQFTALPGTYYIFAFVDANKDFKYQENEDAGFIHTKNGLPAPVIVHSGATVNLEPILISKKTSKLSRIYTRAEVINKILENIGRVSTLENPAFNSNNYEMGVLKPLQFLDQVGGGLYFLEPYQPEKIPVLFVHGINGGPTNWKTIIAAMNRVHFQPWIIFYPSGLRLDIISDYMVLALTRLQEKYGFKQLYIVAHSMGGLVAFSGIKKYCQRYPDLAKSIDLFVTIDSPLNGMKSAALGVSKSPIVLPVWRDLDPESDFIKELGRRPMPGYIPYHLIFSYITGSSDDGVVPLQSQIPLEKQQIATKIHGFNNTHTGILSDYLFLNLLNEIFTERRTEGLTSKH